MNSLDGREEGVSEVGDLLGEAVGTAIVGADVTGKIVVGLELVGITDGLMVGTPEGAPEGLALGTLVGVAVGATVGYSDVGALVGKAYTKFTVAIFEGRAVGEVKLGIARDKTSTLKIA